MHSCLYTPVVWGVIYLPKECWAASPSLGIYNRCDHPLARYWPGPFLSLQGILASFFQLIPARSFPGLGHFSSCLWLQCCCCPPPPPLPVFLVSLVKAIRSYSRSHPHDLILALSARDFFSQIRSTSLLTGPWELGLCPVYLEGPTSSCNWCGVWKVIPSKQNG